MPFAYPTMLARIEANSEKIPGCGCWIWTGRTTTNRSGMRYGTMVVRRKAGRKKGKVRTVFAHRVAAALAKGLPLWRVRVAAHRCDVTLCVNPAHLQATTQRANVLQSYERGRR